MTSLVFSVEPLDAAQERALASAIEAGVFAGELLGTDHPGVAAEDLVAVVVQGRRAWHRFVSANLRLVQMVSQPASRRVLLDADELFQEGVLGLMEALLRYDFHRPGRFATFALPWIRMRVQEAVATRLGEVGLPVWRARARRQVLAIREELSIRLGRPPTASELGEELERPAEWVSEVLAYAEPLSLETVDDACLAYDVPEEVLGQLQRAECRQALAVLSASELAVIVRRFGFGRFRAMSCVEVAGELGVSVSTVRRRERAALARLRDGGRLTPAA